MLIHNCYREHILQPAGEAHRQNHGPHNYQELAVRIKPMHYEFLKEEEVFKDYIRTMKMEPIIQHTDELFHRTLENGLPFPEEWQKSIGHLTNNIATVVKDFINEEEYRSTLSEIEKRISACATFRDCKKEFLDIVQLFITVLQSQRTKKHETIIERCILYIDNNYMDDLSLDSVAHQLFFSPNYLSMIFKNHLGVSLLIPNVWVNNRTRYNLLKLNL